MSASVQLHGRLRSVFRGRRQTTELIARSTSVGAFRRFLEDDLTDLYRTESKNRRERQIAAEVDRDGSLTSWGTDGEAIPFVPNRLGTGWRGTDHDESVEGREWTAKTGRGEDNRPRHVVGQRSRLLDRFASSTTDEFLQWAQTQVEGKKGPTPGTWTRGLITQRLAA